MLRKRKKKGKKVQYTENSHFLHVRYRAKGSKCGVVNVAWCSSQWGEGRCWTEQACLLKPANAERRGKVLTAISPQGGSTHRAPQVPRPIHSV